MMPNPQKTVTTGHGNKTVQGLLLMSLAMLVAPAMDAIAKYISGTIPAVEIGAARFFFQFIYVAPFILILRGGSVRFWPRLLLLNTIRALLIMATTVFFFTAVKWMPIADAISIFFVEPLILTVISAVFLHEHIGWQRLGAICVGFFGALLIIQPSYSIFGLISLLPLAAAVFFACYLALTKIISRTEDPLTMQAFTGFVGFITLGLVMVSGATMEIELLMPVWPGRFEWLLLASIGLIATLTHLMITHAFKRAPASTLAPFQYLEIVGATVLGYLIFGDFPDSLKWLGTFIIVASGLFVLWRERQAHQQKP
jgi:drug/metabolite transporter (DMT)-like permease